MSSSSFSSSSASSSYLSWDGATRRPCLSSGALPLPSRELEKRLFHMLQRCRTTVQLLQLHAQVVINGFSQKNFIIVKLLSSCIAAGDLARASRVVRWLERPSTTVLNQIIRGYSRSAKPEKSLLLYKRWCTMRTRGVVASEAALPQPNSYTYSFLLVSCTRPHFSREGKQVHASVVSSGFDASIFVQTNLVNMYAVAATGWEEDAIISARRVFDDMPHRNIVTWNVIIAAHLRCRDVALAFQLFRSTPEKDAFTWTTMIGGCAQTGRPERALALFEEMQMANVGADEVTLVAVLSACAQLGNLDLGRRIHAYVGGRSRDQAWRERGLLSLDNSLIHMYATCGAVDEAYSVFSGMPRRDTVSWNTMMMGLATHGRAGEVMDVFRRMPKTDAAVERPDGVTLLAVLCACNHTGRIDEGLRCFEHMTGVRSLRPAIEHYGCLVDMLSRAGLLEEARELIGMMPMPPNDVVWGSLVKSCCLRIDETLAGGVVDRLIELNPGRAGGHMVVLSNMHVTARRWEDALRLRQSMRKRGIRKPPGSSRIQVCA
ncbi:unnamed protein product [Spirodela intermedia]|uniref:Uncharacterized protein n=1 Tax=Spirodela intermedia TaxID=51605 RepID=A0A7I8KS99_SPIIN|nr:unnamed protein product [Spirodela intermedia]